MALQFNWILVAALEDYHAELPDGSRNKKANTVYFNRCAKLLQVGCPHHFLSGGGGCCFRFVPFEWIPGVQTTRNEISVVLPTA